MMRMSRFKMQEGDSLLDVPNEDYVMGTAANQCVCIVDHRLSGRAYPLPPIYSSQISALRTNQSV